MRRLEKKKIVKSEVKFFLLEETIPYCVLNVSTDGFSKWTKPWEENWNKELNLKIEMRESVKRERQVVADDDDLLLAGLVSWRHTGRPSKNWLVLLPQNQPQPFCS